MQYALKLAATVIVKFQEVV